MTIEKWIEEAINRIKTCKEIIAEVDFMCGSDWKINKHYKEQAVRDVEFLEIGISLFGKTVQNDRL